MPVTLNEQYLAGTILLEEDVIFGLDGLVAAEDFEDALCRAIFTAANEVKNEGGVADPAAIAARSRRNGTELPYDYIKQLLDITPTAANFAEYARRVAEDARKRRIKDLAAQIQLDDVSSATELAERLQQEAGRITAGADNADNFLSMFKPLTEFQEEEATWLIPGWIPEGQITLIAADGGIGKTTLWCHILAALSKGERCILDPPEHTRSPMKIAFCTTEDSIRKKLLKKLREAGANMANILAMDMAADKTGVLRNFKFGSKYMDQYIKHFKPAACVFDPVQGFVPPKVNMGSRNEMRDCMAPLIVLGEEVGTTFLVICHTNKRKGVYGRDRISDSADLWDIARSVIMAGYTENQGIRYLSNEKNNYAELQETVLYSFNSSGQFVREGTTWKRDKDYRMEAVTAKTKPKLEDCKDCILTLLQEAPNKCIKSDDLVKKVQGFGYAYDTIKRARKNLVDEGVIENHYEGAAGKRGRLCFNRIVQEKQEGFVELPMAVETPFDGDLEGLLPG